MNVQISNLRETLIQKIAFVRGRSAAEVEAEVNAKGDLKIDSKLGQAVVGHVEMALDREGMVRVEDQTKKTLTSLSGLEAMLKKRIEETNGDGNG
ncbi:MAG: hypothetical protein JWO14_3119 [Solirubrobacterales bacterium]|nr:hypothetical protein [Solirubrobacterales bacterium]